MGERKKKKRGIDNDIVKFDSEMEKDTVSYESPRRVGGEEA